MGRIILGESNEQLIIKLLHFVWEFFCWGRTMN
jgi:hypothetical protein